MPSTAYPLHAGFVVVYLVILIGVGAVKARSIRSQTDFSLAGRGLSTFVLVGTLLATWIGTGSIFGNAEETFEVGAAAFLLPASTGVGIVALYLLAPRIRRFGEFTIQDILEARFGVATRVMGTVTLVLAYVIIVSYQYRAGSAVLEYLWPELSATAAKCIVALFVIVYTALAGMYSVAYTDVANGILMTLGVFVALPILYSQAGGSEGIERALEPTALDTFGTYTTAQLVSYLLPILLLLLGDANMVQRFFSAKSPGAARASVAGMFVGVLVLEMAIIAVALLGKALVAGGTIGAPDNSAHIVLHLAFHALPPFLGAMMVATVVAIVVSTADSYLLSPSTSLVRDVYSRFIDKDADEAQLVRAGRTVVILLGLVALGLAFTSDEFFDIALFAYTIYGAGITPALLAAFFWKRATATGAFTSMVAGVGTSVVWYVCVEQGFLARWAESAGWTGLAETVTRTADAEIDAVIPSIVVSVLVLVVVSLRGAPPPPERAEALA